MRFRRLTQLGLLARDSARLRRTKSAENRAAVAERLGGLHGLPQKLGQLLAFSELDGAPGAYTTLTEAPQAMEFEAARALIERHLGRPLDTVFWSLEPRGVSASLAQVHQGTLLDGRIVAVKIKLPKIEEAIRVDLAALGLITAPIGGWKRGLDTAAYRHELSTALSQELDYRREATALGVFGQLVQRWPDVTVPTAIAELSNEHVLTMSWLEGEPFSAVREWSAAERRALGETLLRFFLFGALEWGVVHADPHPGNYRFRRRASGRPLLGVLDFGCVRPVPDAFMAGLRGILSEVQLRGAEGRAGVLFPHFVAMGFKPELLEPMADRLPAVAFSLFAPFHTSGPFDMKDWHPREASAEALGEFRSNFRFAGPPALIFMMRAFWGLLSYLRALGEPVDWSKVLAELPALPVPPAQAGFVPNSQPTAGGARVLRIRLTERAKTKVDVTFRAIMVRDLVELLPEELPPRLAERSIDVEAIVRDAVARGIQPGELFRLHEADREVRVWLE